jgi:hypothetical protein
MLHFIAPQTAIDTQKTPPGVNHGSGRRNDGFEGTRRRRDRTFALGIRAVPEGKSHEIGFQAEKVEPGRAELQSFVRVGEFYRLLFSLC